MRRLLVAHVEVQVGACGAAPLEVRRAARHPALRMLVAALLALDEVALLAHRASSSQRPKCPSFAAVANGPTSSIVPASPPSPTLVVSTAPSSSVRIPATAQPQASSI